ERLAALLFPGTPAHREHAGEIRLLGEAVGGLDGVTIRPRTNRRGQSTAFLYSGGAMSVFVRSLRVGYALVLALLVFALAKSRMSRGKFRGNRMPPPPLMPALNNNFVSFNFFTFGGFPPIGFSGFGFAGVPLFGQFGQGGFGGFNGFGFNAS